MHILLLAIALLAPAAEAKYETCFSASAKKWNVPEALLQAIAKTETDGFHNIPDMNHADHRHMETFGVMGLRNHEILGFSLLDAAKASGQPVAKLISSPCANIDGAAALFAVYRRHHGNDLARALLQFWKLEPKHAKESINAIALALERGSSTGRIRFAADQKIANGLRGDFRSALGRDPGHDDGGRTEGEFPGSSWQASPNFTAKSIEQLYVVIHTTEGSFNGAVSWLTNPESGVSSHYVVRKSDGFVKQLVLEENRAFHARCWNAMAVGIEMEGYRKDSSSFTANLLKGTSNLVAYLAAKYKIPTDKMHIIGHNFGETDAINETPLPDCNDHGDPGQYFPWGKFFKMLNPS